VLYDQRILRIPAHDRSRARTALTFLSVTPYPLQLAEVAECTILDTVYEANLQGPSKPQTQVDLESRLFNPEDMLEILSPFASMDNFRATVALAHPSVRTFLLEGKAAHVDFQLKSEACHLTVSAACLTYMLYVFDRPEFRHKEFDGAVIKRMLHDYPLLLYSAKYWPFHLSSSNREKSKGLLPLSLEVLDPSANQNFHLWLRILRTTTPDSFPLYHAAAHGLTDTAQSILEKGADVNYRGGSWHGTALHAACWTQRPTIVRLLLEHGADSTIKDQLMDNAYDVCIRLGDEYMQGLFRQLKKVPTPLSRSECPECTNQVQCLRSHEYAQHISGPKLLQPKPPSGEKHLTRKMMEARYYSIGRIEYVVDPTAVEEQILGTYDFVRPYSSITQRQRLWTCCTCNEMRNPMVNNDICMQCGHLKCSRCASSQAIVPQGQGLQKQYVSFKSRHCVVEDAPSGPKAILYDGYYH
jgi:Ankyrin repeats (3 copies)